jgi:hypothetical protein
MGDLGSRRNLSARPPLWYEREANVKEIALAFDRPGRMRAGWRLWVVAAAVLWPVTGLGQGADQLASMIEQSLAGIEFRLDLRPYQAAQDLEAVQRRLELLEKEAPDHPALPALKRKLAELQAGITAAAEDAAEGVGAAAVPSAPEGFTAGLKQVDTLQKQAETALLLKQTGEAEGYLTQAEREMAGLEKRYQGEIPVGHAPLIVAKEKLAALRDQIADAKPSE